MDVPKYIRQRIWALKYTFADTVLAFVLFLDVDVNRNSVIGWMNSGYEEKEILTLERNFIIPDIYDLFYTFFPQIVWN
jgi:hypothetical protein